MLGKDKYIPEMSEFHVGTKMHFEYWSQWFLLCLSTIVCQTYFVTRLSFLSAKPLYEVEIT